MSVGNYTHKFIDFQAIQDLMFMITDSHIKLFKKLKFMVLNLRGKTDDEIYQGLVSSEPDDSLFYKTIKYKKLHLLKQLISDNRVDESKRNIWQQYLNDLGNLKQYIYDFYLI